MSSSVAGFYRDDPTTYVQFHSLMRQAFGSASEYSCVDCGKQASDWSWVHGTDELDPDSYVPRCHACNIRYDVSRLCIEDVKEIRRILDAMPRRSKCDMRRTGKMQVRRELAERYGVSYYSIHGIERRRVWRDV